MKRSFLDYYKLVLEKVSFEPDLFMKEYRKALKMIGEHEITQLHSWMEQRGFRSSMIPVERTGQQNQGLEVD